MIPTPSRKGWLFPWELEARASERHVCPPPDLLSQCWLLPEVLQAEKYRDGKSKVAFFTHPAFSCSFPSALGSHPMGLPGETGRLSLAWSLGYMAQPTGRAARDITGGEELQSLERKSNPHRGCPPVLFPILRLSGVQDKALSGRLLQNTWRCHRAAHGLSAQAPTQSHSHTHSVKASMPAGMARVGPASLSSCRG